MTRSHATIASLQECLTLEHEALWTYAYVGARVPAAAERARASYDAHRTVRDRLIAMLHASLAEAPPPASDYAVGAATTLNQARSIARSLEARAEEAYLSLVGASQDADRAFAIAMLRRAALAGLGWGGAPAAFPGMPS